MTVPMSSTAHLRTGGIGTRGVVRASHLSLRLDGKIAGREMADHAARFRAEKANSANTTSDNADGNVDMVAIGERNDAIYTGPGGWNRLRRIAAIVLALSAPHQGAADCRQTDLGIG